jgi:hypothetical protein
LHFRIYTGRLFGVTGEHDFMTDACIIVKGDVVTLERDKEDGPVDILSLCIKTGKTFDRFHGFRLDDIEIESAVSGSAYTAVEGDFGNNDRDIGIGQGDGKRGCTEEHFIDIGSEDTASDLDDIIGFLRG